MHPLRPFQKEAYDTLCQQNHTILIAPTGSGKSLIFQTYLNNFKGSTRAIFISPLNALARQHEKHFVALGLNVHQGVGKEGLGPPAGSGVWILNPEKLFGKFRKQAEEWRPNLLIVDEAHCVWEWGESFRPEFSELPKLASLLKIQKTFWCSATVPAPALAQIGNALSSSPVVLGEFRLPERLEVIKFRVPPHARMELLRSLLDSKEKESGMIFVATRKSSERLLQYLHQWNIPAVSYHAGMSAEERIALENIIATHAQKGDRLWIVATSAFGMGMDYSFLKVCILFEPSFNLLSLAQALGRVGRGINHGQAYVLWHENDFLRHSWLLEHSPRNRERYKEVQTWCEAPDCHRAQLEKYFNGEPKSGKVEE
ncbi:MAG: ATP-dependent DNA helicase RecQ [Bdellovibrionales bacterium]|nr:ATP-dependent DNA helicase RecQ [Oligoflexia bacterium]